MNMKKKSIAGLVFLVMSNLLTGQIPDSLKYISLRPNEFQQAYNKEEKAFLIDVREFFEFRKSRLKNAVNIPSSGNLEFTADTLDKMTPLFLYCTSGFRSKRVARFFYDKGFRNIYSLDGGIMEWKKEGKPVEKKRITRQGTRKKESR
jgi:thioredoxin 1